MNRHEAEEVQVREAVGHDKVRDGLGRGQLAEAGGAGLARDGELRRGRAGSARDQSGERVEEVVYTCDVSGESSVVRTETPRVQRSARAKKREASTAAGENGAPRARPERYCGVISQGRERRFISEQTGLLGDGHMPDQRIHPGSRCVWLHS